MNNLLASRRAVTLAVLSLGSALAHAGFVNGSFENPKIPLASIGVIGGLDVTGWTLEGTGALVSRGFGGGGTGVTWWDAPDLDQYLYIQVSTGLGAVKQSVAVDAGQHALKFAMADFKSQFISPGGQVLVDIKRDSDQAVILAPTLFTTPDFSDFQEKSVLFSAPTTGSYTFRFGTVSGHAGLVDNVRLDAVPEPATMGLLTLGGLAAVARRRRQK